MCTGLFVSDGSKGTVLKEWMSSGHSLKSYAMALAKAYGSWKDPIQTFNFLLRGTRIGHVGLDSVPVAGPSQDSAFG